MISRMRQNPTGWRIEDLERVANHLEIMVRRPGGGSSHVIFGRSGIEQIVSVPAKRPIKPVYIRQFLKLVDAVK